MGKKRGVGYLGGNTYTTHHKFFSMFHHTCRHENKAVISQQGSIDGLELVFPEFPQSKHLMKSLSHKGTVLKIVSIKFLVLFLFSTFCTWWRG